MKTLAITAVLVCLVLAAALAGLGFWQRSVHDSKNDDANRHAAIAATIQKAVGEGTQAGDLLKKYVATGDQSILPQLEEQTKQGVTDLTAAVRQSGGDSNGFLDKGTQFVQASGQVIAKRQAGDVQGAAAVLEALTPKFQEFAAAQQQFIASEQTLAQSANDSADSAESATSWLFITAVALGIFGVSGSAVIVGSRLFRRRSLQPGVTV